MRLQESVVKAYLYESNEKVSHGAPTIRQPQKTHSKEITTSQQQQQKTDTEEETERERDNGISDDRKLRQRKKRRNRMKKAQNPMKYSDCVRHAAHRFSSIGIIQVTCRANIFVASMAHMCTCVLVREAKPNLLEKFNALLARLQSYSSAELV